MQNNTALVLNEKNPSNASTFGEFLDLYYNSEGCEGGFQKLKVGDVTLSDLKRTNCTSSVTYLRTSWNWKFSPGITREMNLRAGEPGQRPKGVKMITAFM